MQLRAVFTQQQYPGSGRYVVASDGLRIIRNIPFSFFSEKGQVPLFNPNPPLLQMTSGRG